MNLHRKNLFTWVIWAIPFLLLLDCCLRPVTEPDIFFYFALIGRYLNTGHWPTTDPFVYTLPGDSLMSLHQWLGYWLYYLPFRLAGWSGPILLKTLAVATFFSIPLLPAILRRQRLPLYIPVFWTLAIFAAHHRFRERVSLFGDLFTLLLVSGLLWCKDARWFWYSLPLLFLVWAQLHPSYPLGWAILIAFFATSRPQTWQRHMLISAALCLVAPLLNPLGIEGVIYPFSFSLNVEPYLRQYVVEWLPLTDSRLYGFRFLYIPFLTFIPLLIWQLWRQRSAAKLFEWILLLLAITLMVKSVRFGLLAMGILLALITNQQLRKKVPAQANGWAMALTALLCLAIAGIKIVLGSHWNIPFADRFAVDTGYFPEQAVDALDRMKPQLNIFNSFGYGGYLAWRWQGTPPIFFHGFSTNFKFYEENYQRPQQNQAELDRLIQKYDIGVFLLSKAGNDDGFIRLLAQHAGWQNIREDGASVIFVKRDRRVFP